MRIRLLPPAILALSALFAGCSTPAPKSPSNAASKIYEVSEVDSPAKAKAQFNPLYPHQGHVILDVVVSDRGKVLSLRPESSVNDAFNAAAVTAVSRWQFLPATKEGHPVAVRIRVPIANGPGEISAVQAEMAGSDLPFAMPNTAELPADRSAKVMRSFAACDANVALFDRTYHGAIHGRAYPLSAHSKRLRVELQMNYSDYAVSLWGEADFSNDLAAASNFRFLAFMAQDRFKPSRHSPGHTYVPKRWSYQDISRFCANPRELLITTPDREN